MSLHRLLAVARKEFRHIARDVRLLFLVTVAPALLLFTLSYVFVFDVERVDVAICDLDSSLLSRSLLASLTADGEFVIVDRVERDVEIEALLARGTADLVLLIPHGFADAVVAGGPADLQCIVDGADALAARQAVTLLESRIEAFASGQSVRTPDGLAALGLEISSRAWYNESLESVVSMVPGMMAIILCMPALALALALTREKETGSFECLVTTPVRGVEYLLGKLLAFELGGLASAILAWGVATFWFRVPFRGSFSSFVLLAAVYLFGSLGFGMVVANSARNQQTAMFLILMLLFVPSFFMAGLITPVADEPVPRIISWLLPPTHFVTISRSVFLKGLGVPALWEPATVLLCMGIASLAGSLLFFEKRIA
jgi:ABC-2 type transport system permease protein